MDLPGTRPSMWDVAPGRGRQARGLPHECKRARAPALPSGAAADRPAPAPRGSFLLHAGSSAARREKQRRINVLARRCGMLGCLGDDGAPDEWADGSPPVGGADLVATLRAGSRARATETVDLDRLGTALEWLREFLDCTGRVPFVALSHAGDLGASIYNSETLEMLAEFIRKRGSRQKGRVGTALASDTVDGYISTIRTMRSREAHYTITLGMTNVVLPAASKRARQVQPPGTRQLRRGLRASHLRQLAAAGYDRSSARGVIEWAAALVGWNLLLRGGELGVVTGKAFDSSRDATFGAIEFRPPCADSDLLPWLTWDVVPIKDVSARLRVCPMAVRRRAAGALGSDPLCVYDAIVMAWRASAGEPPPAIGRATGALAIRPFFLGRKGDVWNTAETRLLVGRMAAALGLDPAEFGGKSLRIGGATDWRDVFGADAERVITQRGRWHSDIAHLYQRALAGVHLRGSAAVGDSTSADLESLCKGWVQPANFR